MTSRSPTAASGGDLLYRVEIWNNASTTAQFTVWGEAIHLQSRGDRNGVRPGFGNSARDRQAHRFWVVD